MKEQTRALLLAQPAELGRGQHTHVSRMIPLKLYQAPFVNKLHAQCGVISQYRSQRFQPLHPQYNVRA